MRVRPTQQGRVQLPTCPETLPPALAGHKVELAPPEPLTLVSVAFTSMEVRGPAPLLFVPQPASTTVVLSDGPMVAAAGILPPWNHPWSLSFCRATSSVEPRACVARSAAPSPTLCAGCVTPWARSFSWSGAGR